MQQLATNLDSANSKEAEKLAENITLEKYLECLKKLETTTKASNKKHQRKLALNTVEIKALIKLINGSSI